MIRESGLTFYPIGILELASRFIFACDLSHASSVSVSYAMTSRPKPFSEQIRQRAIRCYAIDGVPFEIGR